jgi:DNA repair protein RecO (recombination protein O)
MALLKTEGVCLRRIDYSETSQVLHFYTRESGKVHAIAKGSKRRRTRFDGPFDILGRYELVRIPRPPGQLDVLTESELRGDYAALRADYERFAAACYGMRLLETLTVEDAPDRGLYEETVGLLERLGGGAPPEGSVMRFECRALRLLGFFPRTRECGACRRPIGAQAFFGALDGGAVCLGCRPRDPGRLRVDRALLEAMEALAEGIVPPRPPPELRPLLSRYLTFLAERRLKPDAKEEYDLRSV